MNNYVNVTPYNYSLNNPIVLYDPNGRDAIFIHFEKYRINGIPGIGHAGVLVIDNKTGEVQYFDFGRYRQGNEGLARSNTTLGFSLDNIPINSDGSLDQNAISDRLKTISEKVGKNSVIGGAYIESDKYDEMISFAENKIYETQDVNSKDQYSEFFNNCAHFASDIIQQDPNVNGPPFEEIQPFPLQIRSWYETFYPSVYYSDKQDKYYIGNGAEGATK